ncbi:MAG: M15 family metallopeptidase [Synergistaceae bacterium]|nr:M15 family metallopeptidase [Synergistaceae bacterium]
MKLICAVLLLLALCNVCFAEGFTASAIDDEIFARIKGKSYKDNCPVPLEDLRYLRVLHVGFDGQTHEGEMICNTSIAEDLLDIFQKLYEAGYQIEKIRLVDEYDADDELSMRDNNSSCFNFRFISHTTTISKHGLGLAVDINTLYNPYVKMVDGKFNLEPATAGDYVDRSRDFPHKIDENDLCYKLFTEHGFEWGGNWKSVKDYQHFEK